MSHLLHVQRINARALRSRGAIPVMLEFETDPLLAPFLVTSTRKLAWLPEVHPGGIIKAAETLKVEEIGSICGFVLKMGADAYKDEKRFPNGAYCQEGDWVLMRSYSGTRFKVHGKEFRLINDDSVEAVVDDPRGIEKV